MSRVQATEDRTLYAELTALVAEEPDQVLFIEPAGDAHRTVTRAEFLTNVHHIAAQLYGHSIGDGDCIATWLPNWSAAYAWQFAASMVGSHVIGINTRYNVTEVAHVLGKAKPKLLVMAHGFQRLDLRSKARGALNHDPEVSVPVVVPVAGPGGGAPEDLDSYDLGNGVWNLAEFAQAPTAVDVEPHKLSIAFTTSGSTGLPKLAAHREYGVVAHARANAIKTGMVQGNVLIAALPFSGVFGFSASMAAIFAGAKLLLHPVFNEKNLVKEIAEFGGSHFVGADDMLVRIADAWRSEPSDLSSLTWIGIADFQGQSRAIAEWAGREFGTTVVGVYGSSEIFALAGFWTANTDEDRRWGGGGYPASEAIEVRVADPFSGDVLPNGSEGELQFRGPNVVDKYLGDNGEQWAAAFTQDGWFGTGDLGTMCDDGGFVYGCRMGDVLRLKGFLVHPAEIEHRLASYPGVETAKVVGMKTETGEDQAIGFVTQLEGSKPLEAEALRAWCQSDLARYKVPSLVHIIGEMPTTAGVNGTKIRAATLREWAQERAAESQMKNQPEMNSVK